jgi:hypothetical protein
MNFITFFCCLSVLAIGLWGRRSSEVRAALTALIAAGGLFSFFGGFLVFGLLHWSFLGFLAMTVGAFALAIGIPVMHVGAPKAA